MLDFNLKNNEKGQEYFKKLTQLFNMLGADYETKEYNCFITFQSTYPNIEAMIKEEHYLENDYILWIYHYDNMMAEVRIPLEVIDTIFIIH